MKNKILTKVLTIVTVFTVIFSVFCISSSAYTVSYANTNFNSSGINFQLPRTNLYLRNMKDSNLDVPFYLTIPTSDNYSKDFTVVNSFVSDFGYGNTTWTIQKHIDSVNVYDNTGYLQGSEIYLLSSAFDVDFDIYDFHSISLSDYWFSDFYRFETYHGVHNSFSFQCFDPHLWEQISLDDGSVYESILLNYDYVYYDSSGLEQTVSFVTKAFPTSVDGDVYTFSFEYFPQKIYSYIDNYGTTDEIFYSDFNPVEDIMYLKVLSISLAIPEFDINFIHPASEDYSEGIRYVADYVNRIKITSEFGSNQLENIVDSSYQTGLDDGFDDGYSEGYRDASQANAKGPFEILADAVDTFISWEFIPGISVGIVLTIVIGVSLLIAFLKIFAGG